MNLSAASDIILDPTVYCIATIYAILIVWEVFFPASKTAESWLQKVNGILVFGFYFFLSSYVPLFINPIVREYRLIDLTSAGTSAGTLIGVLLYESSLYIWHRQMHRRDFLWRTFHEMHHNAERKNLKGAFFFKPLHSIGWVVLSSVCFLMIAGLSTQAITVTLLIATFLNIFHHANISTPSWLGYIVQRPENHSLHYLRNVHDSNYSDLPLLDILFGTFKSSTENRHETSVDAQTAERIKDTFKGGDVSLQDATRKKHQQQILLDLS